MDERETDHDRLRGSGNPAPAPDDAKGSSESFVLPSWIDDAIARSQGADAAPAWPEDAGSQTTWPEDAGSQPTWPEDAASQPSWPAASQPESLPDAGAGESAWPTEEVPQVQEGAWLHEEASHEKQNWAEPASGSEAAWNDPGETSLGEEYSPVEEAQADRPPSWSSQVPRPSPMPGLEMGSGLDYGSATSEAWASPEHDTHDDRGDGSAENAETETTGTIPALTSAPAERWVPDLSEVPAISETPDFLLGSAPATLTTPPVSGGADRDSDRKEDASEHGSALPRSLEFAMAARARAAKGEPPSYSEPPSEPARPFFQESVSKPMPKVHIPRFADDRAPTVGSRFAAMFWMAAAFVLGGGALGIFWAMRNGVIQEPDPNAVVSQEAKPTARPVTKPERRAADTPATSRPGESVSGQSAPEPADNPPAEPSQAPSSSMKSDEATPTPVTPSGDAKISSAAAGLAKKLAAAAAAPSAQPAPKKLDARPVTSTTSERKNAVVTSKPISPARKPASTTSPASTSTSAMRQPVTTAAKPAPVTAPKTAPVAKAPAPQPEVAAASTQPEPPATNEAPVSTRPPFAISAGMFRTEDKAKSEAARLKKASHMDARTIAVDENGTHQFRVVLGAFETREGAELVAGELVKHHVLKQAFAFRVE